MSREPRVKPLLNVTGTCDTDESDYYDVIRLPMEDGTVVDYQRIIHQQPAFKRVMNLLDKLPVYGGYKAPEIKKSRRL